MKTNRMILVLIVVLSSLTACDNSADKAIEQGKQLLENREYHNALSYFEVAIHEGAEDVEIRNIVRIIKSYNEALRLFEAEDYDGAKEEISTIEDDYNKYAIARDIDHMNDQIVDKTKEDEVKRAEVEIKEDEAKEKEIKVHEKDKRDVRDRPAPKKKELMDPDKAEENIEYKKTNRKSEYLTRIVENEREVNKIYSNKDKGAAQQSEEGYVIWDDFLNEIWGVLKENLPEDEMSSLLSKQRLWITEKEDMAAKIRGDGYPADVAMTDMLKRTERRCKELVEQYME